jgi:hypothetical protein
MAFQIKNSNRSSMALKAIMSMTSSTLQSDFCTCIDKLYSAVMLHHPFIHQR